MIPKYINDWLHVIENMQNENTYKLAWGRALVECLFCNAYKERENDMVVQLTDISNCMLKYYWNQLFFFNLKQSPARVDNRTPVVVQVTNNLIKEYKKLTNSSIPVWYDRAEEVLSKTKYLSRAIKQINNVLPNDVSWRFKKVGNDEYSLYEYDAEHRSTEVFFKKEQIELIKEYSLIISKLLNYKWAQLLEKFNYAPKIVNKVNSISEAKLKRESLVKYKNELLKEFNGGEPIDFYSGKPLAPNDISVDHVIPWSFMYSDDIWNLVLTSKSNNSIKSNSIPSEEIIEKLKERNEKIKNILDDKYSIEMKNAIDNNYIDKYYFECRV